ncbi:hypothetical protein D3C75_837420 [compost metagenome]
MLSPALKSDNQEDRQQPQNNNAVGITQPVPPNREHARNELILRQVHRQQRKCRIAGIGRQDQNQSGRSLYKIVHEIPAKNLFGNNRNHRGILTRSNPVVIRQKHNPRK